MPEARPPQEGAVAVCRLAGDLDVRGAADLRELSAGLLGTRRLVIDLADVPFVDSAGLGALVGAVRRLREAGGRVAVCSPRRPVERVLHTAGLALVVPVVPILADAIAILCEGDATAPAVPTPATPGLPPPATPRLPPPATPDPSPPAVPAA